MIASLRNYRFTVNTHTKAVISFCCFIIAIAKDVLVHVLHVIPVRSLTNMVLATFVVMPLMIVGLYFSCKVILAIRADYKKGRSARIFLPSFFLALPTLGCWAYGFAGLGYGIISEVSSNFIN